MTKLSTAERVVRALRGGNTCPKCGHIGSERPSLNKRVPGHGMLYYCPKNGHPTTICTVFRFAADGTTWTMAEWGRR